MDSSNSGNYNYRQLGDELRGRSRVFVDHQWLADASKLAEQTMLKHEIRIILDLIRGPPEIRPRNNCMYQNDDEFKFFNSNMLNIEAKFNENVSGASAGNVMDNINAMYQNLTISPIGNISAIQHNYINKEPGMGSNNLNNKDDNANKKKSVDKRFKTLPLAETLPRKEVLGGYIFICNNETMQEDLKRQLFGLPARYKDSVRAITPGLPLFLYNYTTHQMHGIFEAASFGGSNIDPTAWEDKKYKGVSRFPAQVRINVRKLCNALKEAAFRPVLHHYDGPKFRLELSVPEALALLDLCKEAGSV